MNNELIDIPRDILLEANSDPILKGYITSPCKRVGIYFENKIVGFFQPTQINYAGQSYWRTGNIYVLPEYRNKGLGGQAIIDFFSDKTHGYAEIVFDNYSSIKAFQKAGFIIEYSFHRLNTKGVKLHLLIKRPPAFTKW